jgi:hypothetical protein
VDFAGLGNSTGLAVGDARLCLRELVDSLSVAGRQEERSELIASAESRSAGAPPEGVPHVKHVRHGTCRARRAHQPRLSHAGMRDLRWWATLASNPYVGREAWPALTSACVAGALNGKVHVCGFFDATNEGYSINELELLAATYGLRAFASFARARELTLMSDSLVTVHIVRNWMSWSPRLLSHLRTLRALCESLGVTLSTDTCRQF